MFRNVSAPGSFTFVLLHDRYRKRYPLSEKMQAKLLSRMLESERYSSLKCFFKTQNEKETKGQNKKQEIKGKASPDAFVFMFFLFFSLWSCLPPIHIFLSPYRKDISLNWHSLLVARIAADRVFQCVYIDMDPDEALYEYQDKKTTKNKNKK